MRVFKTLTLFIVILISKCVKIYAVRKTLKIYGAPQCLPQFTRPPVADNTEVKVTAIVGSSDGSQVYSQLTKTLPCDELITIEPYFRDKEIDKKIYYVAYIYHKYNLSTFIKKIPDDCEYPDYKSNYWQCNFGKLVPYIDRRNDIPTLYEKFLRYFRTHNP